jgi:hypothetical protein
MGLFLNQQDKRSELQERIVADLRAKAVKSELTDKPDFDGSKDIKYLDDLEQSKPVHWAWALIIIAGAVIVALFLLQGRG